MYRPYFRSDYNALQIGVTRPLTNGLLLKGHYTYSRSMALGYSYQLPSAEAEDRNWALANGDRPHTLTMSFVYLLPWQTSTGGGSILKYIINDWQVNGIFQAFSGSPFTVTADGATLNTPGNTQTADLVGTVTKIGAIGAEGVYFDPAAWAQPEGVRFGTARVNQFRGPGGWNLDFSVFRTFPIAARQKLEFRVEASNFTNTPKFANPRAASPTATSCASSVSTTRMRSGRCGWRSGTASRRRSGVGSGGQEVLLTSWFSWSPVLARSVPPPARRPAPARDP